MRLCFYLSEYCHFCFCVVFSLQMALHCDRRETTVFRKNVTIVALSIAEVCWLYAFSVILFRITEVVCERCHLFGQQTLDSNHCLSLSPFL